MGGPLLVEVLGPGPLGPSYPVLDFVTSYMYELLKALQFVEICTRCSDVTELSY